MIWSLAAALAVALAAALLTAPVLRALPRGEGAPDYAALATPRFAAAVGVVTLAAGLLVAVCADHRLLWLPLVAVGVLQAGIDARTTWLPLRLSQMLCVGTAAALAILALTDPSAALRGLAGAGLAGAGFWLIWRLGGIGFGDVRLAPVLGAVTTAESWPQLLAALLLGTCIGAAHAALRLLGRRRGAFPYGPSLVLGTFSALLVT